MSILEDIRAICPPELIAQRNDVAIAAALSVGRVKVQSRLIGIGTILATLGPQGGAFLDGLVKLGETDRNVYWAMELVRRGELDIGMDATRQQIGALIEQFPEMKPAVDALLSLAEVPDPVDVNAVSDALNKAEGRMTMP